MRIARGQFDEASSAAFDAANASSGEALLTDKALLAFARALGIEVGSVDTEIATAQPFIWVRRTWTDVRQDDVIRPVTADGVALDQHAARVVAIGPVCEWHVDDLTAVTEQDVRDRQYRPNEHRLTYSARRVTMCSVQGDPDVTVTPPHGMNPDAPVDIRTTTVEVDAIELLGGWAARV